LKWKLLKSIIVSYVTPCSLVDVYRRVGGTYCLHLQGLRVSHSFCSLCLAYSLILKMAAVHSSETQWHIPEDSVPFLRTVMCKERTCVNWPWLTSRDVRARCADVPVSHLLPLSFFLRKSCSWASRVLLAGTVHPVHSKGFFVFNSFGSPFPPSSRPVYTPFPEITAHVALVSGGQTSRMPF
jgi:hypothetical protein